MTYWYWKDNNQQWRWHLLAANNRIIATGGESYHNEDDCVAAINLVKGSDGAPVRKK